MSISITDRAVKRIEEIRQSQQIGPDAPLRVSVVSGGCSGLTYDLDFDTSEEGQDQDQIFEDSGVKLIIDTKSFLYLAGTKLDYTDGLEGQGFHFYNPNAVRTCSCGESFSL